MTVFPVILRCLNCIWASELVWSTTHAISKGGPILGDFLGWSVWVAPMSINGLSGLCRHNKGSTVLGDITDKITRDDKTCILDRQVRGRLSKELPTEDSQQVDQIPQGPSTSYKQHKDTSKLTISWFWTDGNPQCSTAKSPRHPRFTISIVSGASKRTTRTLVRCTWSWRIRTVELPSSLDYSHLMFDETTENEWPQFWKHQKFEFEKQLYQRRQDRADKKDSQNGPTSS